jgi:uncharacterized protein (TIGR04255 family)
MLRRRKPEKFQVGKMSEPLSELRYAKDPINEAVIQIATSTRAPLESLAKIAGHFKEDYPLQDPLTNLDFSIDATGSAARFKQEMSGYRLTSAKNPDILIVGPESVLAARLVPYAGWEQLLGAIKRVWTQWRSAGNPSSVSRLGVRYINRLDVPIEKSSKLNLSEYLNFFPNVPNFSSKPMAGFFLQSTVPTELDHWSVTLSSTVLQPQPLIDTVSILLDIDVFRTEKIPGRDDDLWECIESVRALKNSIFESCITDTTRKLFE